MRNGAASLIASTLVLLFTFICFGQTHASREAENPWIGVWKLDPTRSHFGAFQPHREQVIRFEKIGETLQFTERVVNASGKTGSLSYTARVDGKEHSIDNSDSKVVLTREGTNTLIVSARKEGKVVKSYKLVVSPDRRTLTFVDATDKRLYLRERDDYQFGR